MYPDLFSCCKNAGETALWIFVYENRDIYTICDMHFTSFAHRAFVKYVINMKIPDRIFSPSQVFEENNLEKMY